MRAEFKNWICVERRAKGAGLEERTDREEGGRRQTSRAGTVMRHATSLAVTRRELEQTSFLVSN